MTLYPLDKMVRLFDALAGGWGADFERPTTKSIKHINQHFGIELPASLVEFAYRSEHFSTWFGGLGEDYANPMHIIRVTSHYRNKRRRKHGDKWRRAMPRQYIVINHGHDDDCDCIDTADWNAETSEFRLGYWCPGMDTLEFRQDSFLHYINRYVLDWARGCLKYKDREGKTGMRAREKFDMVTRILGQGWGNQGG